MFKRLFQRTIFFALLTLLAFGSVELLVLSGFDINQRFPELMRALTALAVLSWAEISITWLRVLMSPRNDEQELARVPVQRDNAMACAAVFAAKQFVWASRLAAFLCLYLGQ